jgi:ATP-dependent Clp protease ATP-binding subunit ClpA
MSEISRASLFGKLNSLSYKAIEGATVFCKLRGNPYVELVHWIQQILQTPDSDLHRITRQFEIDPSRLAADITESLDRLPRGATSISDLSSHVENAVERAWVYATLMFGESRVRTGHLVVGMLKTPSLRNALIRHLPAVREDQGGHADRRLPADSERLPGRRAGVAGGVAGGRPAKRAGRWRRRRWGSRRR